MKKHLYILLALTIIIIVLIYLTERSIKKSPTPEQTNVLAEPQPKIKTIPNIPIKVLRPTQSDEINESTNQITNALTTTNLEQWKAAISGLKPLAGFKMKQDWMMEETNRLDGVPVMLQQNGKTVSLKARFIDITANNEAGDIIEVEIHSPIMDIDETRELGLQLCNMFGLGSSNFLAWCNKVGNNWLDAPLYESRDIHDPNSSAVFAFKTLRTYTNEKPWFIDFIIIPNP